MRETKELFKVAHDAMKEAQEKLVAVDNHLKERESVIEAAIQVASVSDMLEAEMKRLNAQDEQIGGQIVETKKAADKEAACEDLSPGSLIAPSSWNNELLATHIQHSPTNHVRQTIEDVEAAAEERVEVRIDEALAECVGERDAEMATLAEAMAGETASPA